MAFATAQPHHHIWVEKALYAAPSVYIGQQVETWATSQLIRVFPRGQPIKLHKRVGPGECSTDPADYPPGKAFYATRVAASFQRPVDEAGEQVGQYSRRRPDGPLPWARMRQVYRLLGLLGRFGGDRGVQACRQALKLGVIDVTGVSHMLKLALEGRLPEAVGTPARNANVV